MKISRMPDLPMRLEDPRLGRRAVDLEDGFEGEITQVRRRTDGTVTFNIEQDGHNRSRLSANQITILE